MNSIPSDDEEENSTTPEVSTQKDKRLFMILSSSRWKFNTFSSEAGVGGGPNPS